MATDVAVHANSQRVARPTERKYLLKYEQRSISVENWAGQFYVRPNQIIPAKLKGDLLKNACRLQFRAAISDALHGFSIQPARLNNAVRLQ